MRGGGGASKWLPPALIRSDWLKIANKMGHQMARRDENGNCCQIIIYQASLEQEMTGRIGSPQAYQTLTLISHFSQRKR